MGRGEEEGIVVGVSRKSGKAGVVGCSSSAGAFASEGGGGDEKLEGKVVGC